MQIVRGRTRSTDAQQMIAEIAQRADERAAQADQRAAEAQGHAQGADDRASRIEPRADRLERRADALELATTTLADELRGVSGHLPFLLDRLSMTNAANREATRRLNAIEETLAQNHDALAAAAEARSEFTQNRDAIAVLFEAIDRIEKRGEFIRREVLHEISHSVASAESFVRNLDEPAQVSDPDDYRHDLLEREELRLNLGAGHIAVEGYVNVDARELPGIDLVADATALPLPDGTVHEIRSAHLLEHFPHERLRQSVLPYLLRKLRPGGTFVAIVPDAEAMLKAHAEGTFAFDRLRLITYGEQEYDGDYHHTMFSPDSLAEMLEEAGFVDVEVVDRGRENGLCLEFEITARRAETAPT